MLFRVLADAVVVLHCLFVAFVMVGGLFGLRWPRAAWVHVPTALWGAAIELIGWTCPLTPLENWLRRRGGEEGYQASFIEHHLLPILYPAELTESLQIALGGAVIAVNLGIYAWVWVRRRHRDTA